MSFGYREINLIQEEALSLLEQLIGRDNFLKMRRAAYFNLLQNNDFDEFIIHSDVFVRNIVPAVGKIKRLDDIQNVPAAEIFKYYKNFIERADEIAYATNYDTGSFTLATQGDIENFLKNILKPIVDEYSNKYGNDLIDVNFDTDSPIDILNAVIDEFERVDFPIGMLYQTEKNSYMNIINLLEEDLLAIELGQFYMAVPGTEGTRPAFNIFTAIYESLDELPEQQLEKLAEFADIYLILDEDFPPKSYQAFLDDGADARTFLEYRIKNYLSNVVEQGIEYKEGRLTDNNPMLNNDNWSRGRRTRSIGAEFSRKFITNQIDLDWGILLKNSPDPAGFVFALNNGFYENNLLGSANELHMAVNYSTLEKIAEIVDNDELTNNAITRNLFRKKLEDADVSDFIYKYFRKPVEFEVGELPDDNPYLIKLRRAFANFKIVNQQLIPATEKEVAENLAAIDKELEDIARGVGELDEDLTLYHSRPVKQGLLPIDANFHAGTYEAAMDRAILKYAGRPMYQLAAETFTELNDQINAELANIPLGEDYITSVAAEFGTGDNVVEILAEIEWNADNEEVSIRLIMDDEYLSQYPEYNEGVSLDEYGLTTEDTLSDAVGGNFEMEDHINVDSFVRDTPVGVSDEFQWAEGYDLYEVKLAKGAKILSLNVPITVEQKGQTISISADKLQEAVEKGLNQPGSDEVYQGIEAIKIGSNRIEIPENASAEEISDLLFGEYDVIAYTNDIEDVGSISYVIKPQVARVRKVTKNAKRLFNFRAVERFSNTNPFLFKGGFFDADRKMRNILNSISDFDRRDDVNRILKAQRAMALDTDDRMKLVDDMIFRRNNLMNLDIIDTDTPETVGVTGDTAEDVTKKPATIGTPDYTDKVYTQISPTEKAKVMKLYEDGIITPRERDKLLQGQELYPELEEAITKTNGAESLNKSKEIINKNPRIFSKVLSVLEKFDVGDQVIQQVIKRALPRIGMSAAVGPVGIAYAIYETSLLLMDAANAAYKAETTSESFWDNFGEVSDKFSIAYKITKPTYDILLDAIKVDLEDDNTLYSFSR